MRMRVRNHKEHKSIIVRTRKGSTVGCYRFTTYGRDDDTLPSACDKYASLDKVAERVEVNWNIGGDVVISLYDTHPNGFEVKENVIFSRELITDIKIETDFIELR